MKLSIITPVLNEPRVVRALDSIFSQQHEHEIELIRRRWRLHRWNAGYAGNPQG